MLDEKTLYAKCDGNSITFFKDFKVRPDGKVVKFPIYLVRRKKDNVFITEDIELNGTFRNLELNKFKYLDIDSKEDITTNVLNFVSDSSILNSTCANMLFK